jgi:hypothetical protein
MLFLVLFICIEIVFNKRFTRTLLHSGELYFPALFEQGKLVNLSKPFFKLSIKKNVFISLTSNTSNIVNVLSLFNITQPGIVLDCFRLPTCISFKGKTKCLIFGKTILLHRHAWISQGNRHMWIVKRVDGWTNYTKTLYFDFK